jgi:hypothetical protein
MRPTHAPLLAAALRPGNTQQPPHATKQLPHAASAHTTTSFYRRTPRHITSKTDISTGWNKWSFSGPHKLYRVDCLTQPNDKSHTCKFICNIIWVYSDFEGKIRVKIVCTFNVCCFYNKHHVSCYFYQYFCLKRGTTIGGGDRKSVV